MPPPGLQPPPGAVFRAVLLLCAFHHATESHEAPDTHIGDNQTRDTHIGHNQTCDTHIGDNQTRDTHIGDNQTRDTHIGHNQTRDTRDTHIGHNQTRDTRDTHIGHIQTRDTHIGHNQTRDTRDTHIGHNQTRDTRDTHIGHNQTRDTRDTHIGHNQTRDTHIGHNQTRDTRDTHIGHNQTRGTRDTHIGHNQTRDTRDTHIGDNQTRDTHIGHNQTRDTHIGHNQTRGTRDTHIGDNQTRGTRDTHIGDNQTRTTHIGDNQTGAIRVRGKHSRDMRVHDNQTRDTRFRGRHDCDLHVRDGQARDTHIRYRQARDTHVPDNKARDTLDGDTDDGDTHVRDTHVRDTHVRDNKARETHDGDTHIRDTHVRDTHVRDTHVRDNKPRETNDGDTHGRDTHVRDTHVRDNQARDTQVRVDQTRGKIVREKEARDSDTLLPSSPTLSLTQKSSSRKSKPARKKKYLYSKGIRSEGGMLISDLNADFLMDCQRKRARHPNVPVYVDPDLIEQYPAGRVNIDFRSDNLKRKEKDKGISCSMGFITSPFENATLTIRMLCYEIAPFEHVVLEIQSGVGYKFPTYYETLERPEILKVMSYEFFIDMDWSTPPITLRLELQYYVVEDRDEFELNVSMLSPTKGTLRSPFWDGVTAYGGVGMNANMTLDVPPGHWTLVSWEHLGVGMSEDCYQRLVILTDQGDDADLSYCGHVTPPPVLIGGSWLYVIAQPRPAGKYQEVNTGFSMRFSFHNASALPQRLAANTWNCSVAHWTDFRQHLDCNLLSECAGDEDEAACPYRDGTCRQGYLAAGGSCFSFETSPRENISWNDADNVCRRRGARLPSLNTADKWRAVLDLLKYRGWQKVFIGLTSGDKHLPDQYRHVLQWSDLSVAYYLQVGFVLQCRPLCAVIRVDKVSGIPYMDSCNTKITGNVLCEEMSTSRLRIQAFATERKTNPPINTTECPTGHMTHNFLSCDPKSDCFAADFISCSAPVTSLPPSFACNANVERVPFTLVCDHRADCSDASDEFCVFPRCQEFTCQNGQCIAHTKACDGVKDCLDGYDEFTCTKMFGTFSFINMTKPLPAMVLHDGKGGYDLLHVAEPPAQSTPTDTHSHVTACPDSHFQCPGVNYYCLPVYVRCNGVYDCPGHEDELDCATFQCPGFYRCRSSKVCLHGDHVCDGVFQCPQRDDELMCGFVCPVGCTCYGLAFYCTAPFDASRHAGLRFLDASGSGMSLMGILNNTMLVDLSLAKCDITRLEAMFFVNVVKLDLSKNAITILTEKHIGSCHNLQILILSGNPMTSILEDSSAGNVSLPKLHTVDLSYVPMSVATFETFHVLANVLNLNLSNTRLESVSEFSVFKKLVVLDLRGCPVTFFTRFLFLGLDDLSTVYADNYKLCCPDTLPEGFNVLNCHAPFDEVSSCEGLLKSGLYRVSLAILTSLITAGNAGSFVYRVIINPPKKQSSFGIFVTNLCISDFLMGVYSAVIGVADRMYLGNYVWNDVTWRRSAMCKVAGFLSLVSNEVSVLIICLITVDRFLVTRFPFSRQLHFSCRAALFACVTAWSVGVLLAVTPLLPVVAHWEFYSHTGICVPLPVTRTYFAGREYSFGIMIILNFVLFLLITCGQVSIYLSVRANSMATSDTTQKARDLTIARRLITVVVSDFLCWFPVGLLGLLSSQGHAIPGVASVVVAVFVLPLNPALNPFLYTVNVILERRQRAREERLQKMILTRHRASLAQREDTRTK